MDREDPNYLFSVDKVYFRSTYLAVSRKLIYTAG